MEKDRFMRLPEVTRITGRPKSSLKRDIDAGRFPRPVKIGPRAVAWPASLVQKWMSDTAEGVRDDS